MAFDTLIAQIRFGMGLRPGVAAPVSVADMLTSLAGPDRAAADIPIAPFARLSPPFSALRAGTRARNKSETEAERAAAVAALRVTRLQANAVHDANMLATIARMATAQDGFRERLVAFWADHFTVASRNNITRHGVTPYVEEAVRPYVAGSFAAMLRASVTHPMMLVYLDQTQSVGPNSERGKRIGRGLNENLAREILELHTLGVDGGYDQTDIGQLAELLAGLTYDSRQGWRFQTDWAEPGAETVLGVTYGARASLAEIHAALDDIAAHPDTGQHLAFKLAQYFVADTPDTSLVDAMAAAYRATDGQLLAVYDAMLSHPAAWQSEFAKVKPPLDFIASSLRALGVPAAAITGMESRDFREFVDAPLRVMGQPWEKPIGPDGWPETAQAWIIPQTMAGRINWAMQAPSRFVNPVPDPRDFVTAALGDAADPAVRFAAQAAEDRSEGVGVILASAAFQRR